MKKGVLPFYSITTIMKAVHGYDSLMKNVKAVSFT